LPVNLPTATTAQTQQQTQINVSITSDGQIALNRQPIELNNLEEAVRKLIEPNSESLIVINADRKVEHGQVVEVMDRLRQLKGAKRKYTVQGIPTPDTSILH
jgi:biopolymer transport protein ExbD